MSPGLVALVVVLAVVLAAGAAWRSLNGRMRRARRDTALTSAGHSSGVVLTSEQLRAELGGRATLVQFSSAFCAPCRATRRVLADVAGMVDGVTHVEIDAESRLDLVRDLNVLRTPTVLVLDRGGRVVSRGSGQPRKPDVIAALGDAVGPLGASNLAVSGT